MILVKPSFKILTKLNGLQMLKNIERAGRTCYKSEHKITDATAGGFVKGIIASGHLSVIEHENISVLFICDRGVTHELVRHRLCAFSQESTRYCNYKGGVTFVIPPWLDLREGEWERSGDNLILPVQNSNSFILHNSEFDKYREEGILSWLQAMLNAELEYIFLLSRDWTPQQARSVLPNSLKTEIVVTANIREWRHILNLHTSNAAHPQIREIMSPILAEFKAQLPILFDDL